VDALSNLSFGWAALTCTALAFVSALLPWVNAELLVLSLPAVAGSNGELATLVLLATSGQMAGKCVIYWTARRAGTMPSGRLLTMLEGWRTRAAAHPASPVTVLAISSIVGVPPFYVMSAIAGALRVNFCSFLVAGTFGRLVRFSAIAWLPQIVLRAT
jgi:membrane protein YqaA with SNARE-associated domain